MGIARRRESFLPYPTHALHEEPTVQPYVYFAANYLKNVEPIVVDASELVDYVGQPPFTNDKIYNTTPPGVVMGLAYTSLGGSSLYIEAVAVEKGRNKGSLKTTGKAS